MEVNLFTLHSGSEELFVLDLPFRWYYFTLVPHLVCVLDTLINSFFVNMAVGLKIAKTCCSQSGAIAIAYLGAQKVCRIYSINN